MLAGKYSPAIDLARKLGFSGVDVKEDGGKLKVKATAPYQFDKDLFWDKLKTIANWNTEVEASINVQHTDVYGFYTVVSGDTLSKIAKAHLGDAMRYMEIFNINKDVLTNPDMIKVGQKIKLPSK